MTAENRKAPQIAWILNRRQLLRGWNDRKPSIRDGTRIGYPRYHHAIPALIPVDVWVPILFPTDLPLTGATGFDG